jgi:hypothetical protein
LMARRRGHGGGISPQRHREHRDKRRYGNGESDVLMPFGRVHFLHRFHPFAVHCSPTHRYADTPLDRGGLQSPAAVIAIAKDCPNVRNAILLRANNVCIKIRRRQGTGALQGFGQYWPKAHARLRAVPLIFLKTGKRNGTARRPSLP